MALPPNTQRGSSEPLIPMEEGTALAGPTPRGSPIPMQVDPSLGDGATQNMVPTMEQRPRKSRLCGAERRRRKKVRLGREGMAPRADLPLQPLDSASGEGTLTNQKAKSGPLDHQDTKPSGHTSKILPKAPASKRQRAPGSTPEAACATKRPRSGHTGRWQAGYAQVAAEDRSLQVVISREGELENPFSEDQLLEFLDAVGEAITQAPTGSDTPLQFSSTRLWRGQLLVTAANQASKDWLLRSLNEIRPWSGTSLVAVDPALLKLKKAVLWIPAKKPLSNEDTLRALERQNPGLTCRLWRIWRRKEEPHGLNLIVGMDEKSISTLKGLNFQPYYSATRAKVTIEARRTGVDKGTAKKKAETSSLPRSTSTVSHALREPEQNPEGRAHSTSLHVDGEPERSPTARDDQEPPDANREPERGRKAREGDGRGGGLLEKTFKQT